MKKVLIVLCLLLLTGCNEVKSNKVKIVSTAFVGYDFSKEITKDLDVSVSMLLKPGAELHTYEPSPKDIAKIMDSDLFIYVGGESDEWVDDILSDLDKDKTKVVKMMDYVDLKKEELKDGMEGEEEDEYDEHVWTSPVNAKKIVEGIYKKLTKANLNKLKLEENKKSYIKKLDGLDKEFRDIVENSERKTLIFADRFPLRYFVDEYNLDYYAAFKGCSSETEASSSTISFLIDKVKNEKIPVIFKIEMGNDKLANTIKEETNAKVLTFNSLHNITKSDYLKGKNYISLMKKNAKNLKEALNGTI